MAIPDARAQAYIQVFKNQNGGQLSVFRGLDRYQSGQGFGDFFRGLLRHVIPVAINVGKAALGAFAGAHDQGASIQDSLKAAIRPATSAAIGSTIEQINKAQAGSAAQAGIGKRKRVYKHKKRSKKMINYNF